MIEVPKKVVETVQVETILVHAKVCDSAGYQLLSPDRKVVAKRDDYVPSFFPGDHYGDYLELEINIATGQIVNWPKKIDPIEVARAFNLIEKEE